MTGYFLNNDESALQKIRYSLRRVAVMNSALWGSKLSIQIPIPWRYSTAYKLRLQCTTFIAKTLYQSNLNADIQYFLGMQSGLCACKELLADPARALINIHLSPTNPCRKLQNVVFYNTIAECFLFTEQWRNVCAVRSVSRDCASTTNKPTTNTEAADEAEILANCTLSQHMQF